MIQGEPSRNGGVACDTFPLALQDETCLQYVIRVTQQEDVAHWRYTLAYCHVPPEAPAHEWMDALQRVRMSADHLIHKEKP